LRKEDVEIIMPEEIVAKKFKTEHEEKITDAESIIFKLVELKDPKVIPRLIEFTKSESPLVVSLMFVYIAVSH